MYLRYLAFFRRRSPVTLIDFTVNNSTVNVLFLNFRFYYSRRRHRVGHIRDLIGGRSDYVVVVVEIVDGGRDSKCW
ncbi:hypothetical protein MtrunA17_Chr1g0197571 [Medicago truncatula]|uniref:Transmembrane protein n=1 Tax=Medicago truncatula TaxID=3880 RepID=A0A396JSL6_MEDTR|nr:hypothetical protein MtrunA17_Chr1g0197571 [Medicago truncatula]